MAAIIDYRGKTPQKTNAGIPLITAKVVKGGRIETPTEFIAPEDYESWMRRGIPRAGDVLLTTEAPLGEVAQLGAGKIALAQRIIALRGKAGILDNGFLKYLMQSNGVQMQLQARASGTTVLGIKQSELRKVELSLPPLPEQRAIAHVLGTLDDKIELNLRMNETLEGMARALFKSWFVDFDPVRAKMDGRPTGLPPELDALLPDALVESPLGEIPVGWEVVELGHFVEVVKGRSYKSVELADSDTALVTLKSFNRGGGYREDGLKPYTGRYRDDQIVKPGEIVVAFTDVTQAAEVIGRPAVVSVDPRYSTLVASLDTAIVRPKNERLTVPFLFQLLMTTEFNTHAYAHTSGTTVLHLSKNALPTFQFVLPDQRVLQASSRLGHLLLDKIDNLQIQDRLLSDMRDTLLPRLISGEVRI